MIINEYIPGCESLTLFCDLASEFPIYLYLSSNKESLLYSSSITGLLSSPRVKKPLPISTLGIAFLLQNGVTPSPTTVYNNLFVLGIGDKAEVKTIDGKIDISFTHHFPFMSANRREANEMMPDEESILQMLAEATISRINDDRPSFLFHSAGKDSNSIALALAAAGWQNRVKLVSHKSKGDADESATSKKLAMKMGFKHEVLYEVDRLQAHHRKAIDKYFMFAPFPCVDNVCLAYPLYAQQLIELHGANIIDGGGNDSYMMTPITNREDFVLPLAKLAQHLRFIRRMIKSESLMIPLSRTPAEWFRLSGMSYMDARKLYSNASDVFEYWNKESISRSGWDLVDFKTDVYTTKVISEMHIRKVRNFADSIAANLILPFANEAVASYFSIMPEKYLHDRKQRKNKLILRNILKDRIGLDSDKIGKMGFNYDSKSVILNNWEMVIQEIYSCQLWNEKYARHLAERMKKRMDGFGWGAGASGRLLYRLYLL